MEPIMEDDPKRPKKAIGSTIATLVVGFILYWVSDEDPFTAKEAGLGVVAALVAAGLVGGTTFGLRNPKRFRTQRGALEPWYSVIVMAAVAIVVVALYVLLFDGRR